MATNGCVPQGRCAGPVLTVGLDRHCTCQDVLDKSVCQPILDDMDRHRGPVWAAATAFVSLAATAAALLAANTESTAVRAIAIVVALLLVATVGALLAVLVNSQPAAKRAQKDNR